MDGYHAPCAALVLSVSPCASSRRGVSAIPADGGTVLPVDVLFKQPWRISPAFEFMVGAGPELIHATGPDHVTYWGFSAVLDFMFWPRKDVVTRRITDGGPPRDSLLDADYGRGARISSSRAGAPTIRSRRGYRSPS